jgi:hypothetical protein
MDLKRHSINTFFASTILFVAFTLLVLLPRTISIGLPAFAFTDVGLFYRCLADLSFCKATSEPVFSSVVDSPTMIREILTLLKGFGFDPSRPDMQVFLMSLVVGATASVLALSCWLIARAIHLTLWASTLFLLLIFFGDHLTGNARFIPLDILSKAPFLSLFANAISVLVAALCISNRMFAAAVASGVVVNIHPIYGMFGFLLVLVSSAFDAHEEKRFPSFACFAAFAKSSVARVGVFCLLAIVPLSKIFGRIGDSFYSGGVNLPIEKMLAYTQFRSANPFVLADGPAVYLVQLSYFLLTYLIYRVWLLSRRDDRAVKILFVISICTFGLWLLQILFADVIQIMPIISGVLHRFTPTYQMLLCAMIALLVTSASLSTKYRLHILILSLCLIFRPQSLLSFEGQQIEKLSYIFAVSLIILRASTNSISWMYFVGSSYLVSLIVILTSYASAAMPELSFLNWLKLGMIQVFPTVYSALWPKLYFLLISIIPSDAFRSPLFDFFCHRLRIFALIAVMLWSLAELIGRSHIQTIPEAFVRESLFDSGRQEKLALHDEITDFLKRHVPKDALFHLTTYKIDLVGIARQYADWENDWYVLYTKEKAPEVIERLEAVGMDFTFDSPNWNTCGIPKRWIVPKCLVRKAYHSKTLHTTEAWQTRFPKMKQAAPDLKFVVMPTSGLLDCPSEIRCEVLVQESRLKLVKVDLHEETADLGAD